jgi:hypothetical protein
VANKFASGKNSIAECDRCGFRFKLKELKKLVIKTKTINLLVCSSCWEKDQPQLQLGLYPVNDPQAIRNPRRDNSYIFSGANSDGNTSGGSRVIEWGWAPVGGGRSINTRMTPNNLALRIELGIVAVVPT